MKRKLLLSLAFMGALLVGVPSLKSLPQGTPSDGRTGSPGDGGKTCAAGGCHNASVSDAGGIISSNVPAEGYTPGASYTITVSLDGSGKKGLCVSPQAADGTVLGTLSAGSGSQMVGKGYITHTTPKTSNPAVWTFTWVAPANGTGAVNFYGAFANGTFQVRKSIYTVAEKTATGINENKALANLSLYPNPISNQEFNLAFDVKHAGQFKIALTDITGKEVYVIENGLIQSSNYQQHVRLPELNKGIYFLSIQSGSELLTKKLLVQ